MRPIFTLALTLLLTVGYASADTTVPATGQTASVLILPFTAPAAAEYQWVGQSVQQVLASDLSHGSTLKVMAPASAKSAADADEALKIAADAGATLVVFGQTQVLDKEIRLTGEILDVTTGRSITGLKATGPTDQLFHLEDAVASQSLNALPDRMRDDEWRDRTGYAAAPEPAPESNASSPSVYDYGSGPYDSGGYYSSYPGYSYYSYPSYPYPYYYPYGFYGGVFFDFHDHGDHHDHHDDFHHGDSHNHGDFHGHGDSHGQGDFHSGGSHSGGSMGGGFSHGSMPGSTFGGGRGGMTSPGRAGGFSGGGFSGGRAGGFSGGGFHGGMGGGGMGGGGGGFHGGMGGGGGGFHGGGGGHR